MYLVIVTLPNGAEIVRMANSIRQIEQKAIDIFMEHFTMSGTYRDILEQFRKMCERVPTRFFLLDMETGEGYPFSLENTQM